MPTLRRKDTSNPGPNPGWFARNPVAGDLPLESDMHILEQSRPSTSLIDFPEHILELSAKFNRHNKDLYAVGGIVRDAALGLPTSKETDIDLTTDAVPEKVHELLEGWADFIWDLGEKFGTVGAIKNETDIEITTYRTEQYTEDTRKPDIQFSESLDEDLGRRDFTINAMAVNISTGELADPYGGITDLENKVLRTPANPDVIFSDDPLRMLRAARFIARFDMEPNAALTSSIQKLKHRLCIVSGERIHQETTKLLKLPNPRPGLEFLRDTGLMQQVLGEVNSHDIELASRCQTDKPFVKLALLFASCDDKTELKACLKAWHVSRTEMIDTMGVHNMVQQVKIQVPSSEPDLRRFIINSGKHLDVGMKAVNTYLDSPDLDTRINKMMAKEPDLGQPVLNGQEIMDTLKCDPGPIVGKAHKWLAELRIEHGPLSKTIAKQSLQRDFAISTH